MAQATPLWGGEAHRAFRDANPWVLHFLPNVDAAARREPMAADTPSAAGRGERWLEALLAGGRLASLLDRLVHSLLLSYYGLRLRHRGLDRHRLASSYRRDRQEVAAGGYASAVEETFRRRVGERLGEHEALARDLERLFPSAGRRERPDPSFARLLSSRYGESRLGEAS